MQLRSAALASLAAAALALTACTDALDGDDRDAFSAATSTVVERATVALYLGLHDPSATTFGTGTRDHFTIAGTIPNPWHPDQHPVTGTAQLATTTLSAELEIELAGWHDDLFELTLDGTLAITEHATYLAPDDLIPNDADVHLTGELSGHTVDLMICDRGLTTTAPRYGLLGTVDGAPASDHYAGNDAACR